MQARPARVAACASLATTASLESRRDEPALELRDRAEQLANQSALRVVGTVAIDRAVTGLEDLDVLALSPCVGQDDLLDGDASSQSVEAMNHDALGVTVLEGVERRPQPRTLRYPERSRSRLVVEDGNDLMAGVLGHSRHLASWCASESWPLPLSVEVLV